MRMATPAKRWTVDEVHAPPDDGSRYEVVDGELLATPAPSWPHGTASKLLFVRLHAYATEHGVADVHHAPADVPYGPRTAVQPDLFAVPLVDGRRPRTWEEAGRRLLLAVEVPSPTSARADRIVKRRLYQREGVPEYWIVDVDARLVERWRPADERPEVLTDAIAWRPDPARPPLDVDLAAYFADVVGG